MHEDISKDWIARELIQLQNCIRHEKNQHRWISRELCEYLDKREMPQVIAEVLALSNF